MTTEGEKYLLGEDCALVLEGGGMRGVFTSGVLDAFMKHELWFPYCVSVSAGACNGLSYASRQSRRARMSNIDMLVQYKYIGIDKLIKSGNIFDSFLLYERFPNKIIPYDYDTYYANPMRFEMVVTNCNTGHAEYLSEHGGDNKRLLAICQGSSSLPYVSKMVTVDGKPMLDGGIVDSIPVKRALDMGYKKCVVIMTRNKGYRKTGKDRKIPPLIYKDYPRLRVALSRRLKSYNEQLEFVEQLERDGDIMCIRPERPIEVDRIEKDVRKLQRLYEEGFAIGDRFCREIIPSRQHPTSSSPSEC
ncbi:MAG: patatin family protein [Prevotella sp.]|nr:patatin family protein [Prevotella sp.]